MGKYEAFIDTQVNSYKLEVTRVLGGVIVDNISVNRSMAEVAKAHWEGFNSPKPMRLYSNDLRAITNIGRFMASMPERQYTQFVQDLNSAKEYRSYSTEGEWAMADFLERLALAWPGLKFGNTHAKRTGACGVRNEFIAEFSGNWHKRSGVYTLKEYADRLVPELRQSYGSRARTLTVTYWAVLLDTLLYALVEQGVKTHFNEYPTLVTWLSHTPGNNNRSKYNDGVGVVSQETRLRMFRAIGQELDTIWAQSAQR